MKLLAVVALVVAQLLHMVVVGICLAIGFSIGRYLVARYFPKVVVW